ncbi:36366_t:CDS:2, partial [Racocetra persica]
MPLRVKALYDCFAEDASELSFRKGDIIVDVVETEELGWLRGRKENSQEFGLIPENYVEVCEEKAPPKLPPRLPPRKPIQDAEKLNSSNEVPQSKTTTIGN